MACGAETREDRFQWLDFFQSQPAAPAASQAGHEKCRSFSLGQLLICAVVALFRLAYVCMHAANKFRRSRVKLRAFPEAIQAMIRNIVRCSPVTGGVHVEIILQQRIERLRAGITGGILKIFAADIFIQSKQFKQVAVAVTGNVEMPMRARTLRSPANMPLRTLSNAPASSVSANSSARYGTTALAPAASSMAT